MSDAASPLIVRAHLSSPLAGEPPRLDSLLVDRLAVMSGLAHPKWMIDRSRPLPVDIDDRVRIPLCRQQVGPWQIALASNAIYRSASGTDRHDYINRKLAVEFADLLAPSRRLKIAVGNAEFKSYRLPLRARFLEGPVVWFALGSRKSLLSALKHVHAIGKKTSIGYGRVIRWEVNRTDNDLSWFAPTEAGTLLMATLPFGKHLPSDLIGYRRDYAGCCPPYWHPERYADVVVPC